MSRATPRSTRRSGGAGGSPPCGFGWSAFRRPSSASCWPMRGRAGRGDRLARRDQGEERDARARRRPAGVEGPLAPAVTVAAMRAVGVSRFGGPEVLEVVELPEPVAGDGEVRIRVAAATVNPTDIGLRDGHRAEVLKDLPPPWVPGMELAGEIDAVGAGSDWSPGQRVIAIVLPFRPLGGAQ